MQFRHLAALINSSQKDSEKQNHHHLCLCLARLGKGGVTFPGGSKAADLGNSLVLSRYVSVSGTKVLRYLSSN